MIPPEENNLVSESLVHIQSCSLSALPVPDFLKSDSFLSKSAFALSSTRRKTHYTLKT